MSPKRSSSFPSISVVIGLFFALGAIFVFETLESHASFHIDLAGLGKDRVSLNIRNDDGRLSLRREGVVVVAEDGSIERADAGARLKVEDRDRRRSVVIEGRDGEPEIVYRRGRETRPFDAEARAWLADMMRVAYRRGGLDSERRAGELLEQGIAPLVDEVRRIDSDHVVRRYLELALETDLTADELARVLGAAASQIDGDHDQMVLLRDVPIRRLTEPGVLDAYLRAMSTIDGDYSMRRALDPLLDDVREPAVLEAVFAVAAKEIESDHDAAQLVTSWVDQGEVVAPLPASVLVLLSSIDSDFEQRRAAVALASELPLAEIPRLVDSVDQLDSEFEHAQFLLEVIDRHARRTDDAEQVALRASIERSMARLDGEFERRRVAEALAGD